MPLVIYALRAGHTHTHTPISCTTVILRNQVHTSLEPVCTWFEKWKIYISWKLIWIWDTIIYSNSLLTCRWSSNLPGVAINILTPLQSFSASVLRLAPPITIPNVWWWYLSSSLATPYVCSESSLIGEITITPVPAYTEHAVWDRQFSVQTGFCQTDTKQSAHILRNLYLNMHIYMYICIHIQRLLQRSHMWHC